MTTPFERTAADDPLRATWRALSGTVPAPGAHLTEDEWVRLAAGELDAPAHARAADHIEACADCAEVFRALSHLREGAVAIDPDAPAFVPSSDDVLDRSAAAVLAPPAVTADAPSRSGAWWYGVAAAAIVVLAVAGVLLRRSSGPTPGGADAAVAEVASSRGAGEVAAVGVPSVPPAAPAPVRPAPDVPPARRTVRTWAVLTSAPAVMLPPSLTLVTRGNADTERDAFLAAFGPAITPYRARRYDEAARALTAVTRRFPAVAEGWFYLGVALLHAGRAAEALDPLDRAQASEVVADEARWLTAVALEHAGRRDEAMTAVLAVCDGDGPRRDTACAAAGRRR